MSRNTHMTLKSDTFFGSTTLAQDTDSVASQNRTMTKKIMNGASQLSQAQLDLTYMDAIANQRDQKALAKLFMYYGPKLKGWLIARGAEANTAEDVIQDVMIRVWTRAETYDASKAAFSTWVYRMTRNRWIDIQRKHRRMDVRDPQTMNVIADEIVESAEGGLMQVQVASTVNKHIDLLKPEQKRLIHMAFKEHKTHIQISDETGLPLGTVKTRIRSAMKTLRVNIDKEAIR